LAKKSGPKLDNSSLAERQRVLIQLAERAGINWKRLLANVPDDDRARVAALATLLGMNAHLSLMPEISMDELAEQAMRTRVLRQLFEPPELPIPVGPRSGDEP
jgi:hypothetical protein